MDWIWALSSLMSRDGRISLQRPITRSLSAGETLTRSATFHALSPAYDHRDVRRTSIGSSATITHTHTPTQWRWCSATCEVKLTLLSSVFLPFIQHHTCPSWRIRMETSLWRYCKPSKQALQGGMTHSPELLQLRNMLCLYFPAPLICQSRDSANRLGLLVFVLRNCPARLLLCFAISLRANLDRTCWLLASDDILTLVFNFRLDKLVLSGTGDNPV